MNCAFRVSMSAIVEQIPNKICNFLEDENGRRVFYTHSTYKMFGGGEVWMYPCIGDPGNVQKAFGGDISEGLHVSGKVAVYGLKMQDPISSPQEITRDLVGALSKAIKSMNAGLERQAVIDAAETKRRQFDDRRFLPAPLAI